MADCCENTGKHTREPVEYCHKITIVCHSKLTNHDGLYNLPPPVQTLVTYL